VNIYVWFVWEVVEDSRLNRNRAGQHDLLPARLHIARYRQSGQRLPALVGLFSAIGQVLP
jgi:hypothetical protein